MKKKFLLFLLFLLPLFLSGCSLSDLFLSTKSKTSHAGIFKSVDYGENFKNSSLIGYKNKKPITINNFQIDVIKIDPLNHKNIFLGTLSGGVWYSNNSGESWRHIFKSGRIYDIALDPNNTGVVYITNGKKVYKSLDLGKNWSALYWETRRDVVVSALTIDTTNNLILYLGTSSGEAHKTIDGGASWEKIFEVEDTFVKKILVNPKNDQIVYLATAYDGIFKSTDGGVNWVNLKNNYFPSSRDNLEERRERKGIVFLHDLIFDPTKNDALIYGSNYGLIKSDDGGKTWQDFNILTPARKVYIRELAINPRDNQQIYYGTRQAFYRSFDGGKTWLVSALPTTLSVGALAVDPINPNTIFMGMKKIK